MKSSALRIGVLALGIFLFNWQPAAAGCNQECTGVICEDRPNNPTWGCQQGSGSCTDFWCSPTATLDQELLAKIEKAALAGDTHTVTLLAAAVGQPIRIHSGGKVVYDGFALAGLKGPGSGATDADRLAACGTSKAPAEPAALATETAKVSADAP